MPTDSMSSQMARELMPVSVHSYPGHISFGVALLLLGGLAGRFASTPGAWALRALFRMPTRTLCNGIDRWRTLLRSNLRVNTCAARVIFVASQRMFWIRFDVMASVYRKYAH